MFQLTRDALIELATQKYFANVDRKAMAPCSRSPSSSPTWPAFPTSSRCASASSARPTQPIPSYRSAPWRCRGCCSRSRPSRPARGRRTASRSNLPAPHTNSEAPLARAGAAAKISPGERPSCPTTGSAIRSRRLQPSLRTSTLAFVAEREPPKRSSCKNTLKACQSGLR